MISNIIKLGRLRLKINEYKNKLIKSKKAKWKENETKFNKYVRNLHTQNKSVKTKIDDINERIKFISNALHKHKTRQIGTYSNVMINKLYSANKFINDNFINHVITSNHITSSTKANYINKKNASLTFDQIVRSDGALSSTKTANMLGKFSLNNIMNANIRSQTKTNAIHAHMKNKNKMNLFNVLNKTHLKNPEFLKLLISHDLKKITDLYVYKYNRKKLTINKPSKQELINKFKNNPTTLNNFFKKGRYVVTINDNVPKTTKTTIHGNNTYLVNAHGVYNIKNMMCFKVPVGITLIFLTPLGRELLCMNARRKMKHQRITNKYTQGQWMMDIDLKFSHPAKNTTKHCITCGIDKVGKNLKCNRPFKPYMTNEARRAFTRNTFKKLNIDIQNISSNGKYSIKLSKLARNLPKGIYYLSSCRGLKGISEHSQQENAIFQLIRNEESKNNNTPHERLNLTNALKMNSNNNRNSSNINGNSNSSIDGRIPNAWRPQRKQPL